MNQSSQITIAKLPIGRIKPDDFRLGQTTLPEVGEQQVLVRNMAISLDPYMRITLSANEKGVAAYGPGDVLHGGAVGIVEQSRSPAFPEGSHVISNFGWRTHFVATPEEAGLAIIEDGDVPLEWYLGFLGLTGITAWRGIEEVLQPEEGQAVLISGAAGAVGSVACQLAKRRGARVLATAGSDEKAQWLLDDLKVDAVVNYRTGSIEDFIAEQAPDGIDCYFDNVGGPMLEAMLPRMKVGGRVAICGTMSQYEGGDFQSGPANFFNVLERSLRLEGFSAFAMSPQEQARIIGKLKELASKGELKPYQTIVEGLDKAPSAFAAMFGAGQIGKLVIKL